MTNHLVILRPYYLSCVLRGIKTAECRLSRTLRPPFGRVAPGDTLWLKRSGGCVVARAQVVRVTSFHPVSARTLRVIKRRFGSALQAKPCFFEEHTEARFATLMELDAVSRLEPFRIAKCDRRAWVVLSAPPEPGTRLI